MNYFRLAHRVPETSAVEPRVLTWLYGLISRVPLVRTAHRRFVAGALAQGVTAGYGLDLGTGPGYVALEVARQQPALHLVGLDLAAHMVMAARRQAVQAGSSGHPVQAGSSSHPVQAGSSSHPVQAGSSSHPVQAGPNDHPDHIAAPATLWPQGDGHRLPFAAGTFDLVLSSFALHHWDEPLAVLNEIARVLRPPDAARGYQGGRYYIADLCREASAFQRLFAYASIPAVSLPFGSYLGYGGYYESVRAGYTRAEAQNLLARSDLPPGVVGLDSTWFVPVVTISSAGRD